MSKQNKGLVRELRNPIDDYIQITLMLSQVYYLRQNRKSRLVIEPEFLKFNRLTLPRKEI